MNNRLKIFRTDANYHDMTRTLQKRYKGYKCKLHKIQNMVFIPIHAQRHKTNLCFSQDMCNYTPEGREKIHKGLKAISKEILSSIMNSFIPNRTIEYNELLYVPIVAMSPYTLMILKISNSKYVWALLTSKTKDIFEVTECLN